MSTITQSEIVSEIVKFGMHGMGIGEPPEIAKLSPLSLQDIRQRMLALNERRRAARAGIPQPA